MDIHGARQVDLLAPVDIPGCATGARGRNGFRDKPDGQGEPDQGCSRVRALERSIEHEPKVLSAMTTS